MADLALSLPCDRLVLTTVHQIANQRVDDAVLLGPADAEPPAPPRRRAVPPRPRRLRARDQPGLPRPRRHGRRGAAGGRRRRPLPFPTAPSFRDADGGCFFAWYSTAITGNGNVYPCCQLIKPDGPVLGNVLSEDFADVWEGDGYQTLRNEMRDVLVEGADRTYPTRALRGPRPGVPRARPVLAEEHLLPRRRRLLRRARRGARCQARRARPGRAPARRRRAR